MRTTCRSACQLIGPRFGEQTLLNAGLAFEQASGLKNIIAAL